MGSDFSGTERYIVERQLGTGAFGVVYQVHDRRRDERVALKTLQRLDAQALYRFKQEFRSLADVRHPNLVSLYDLMSEGDQWFFTMELVHGQGFLSYLRGEDTAADPLGATLGSTLDRQASAQAAPASPVEDGPRLRRTLLQLCAGIMALHRVGVLHRDVKPSNVLVTGEGRVVLLDFGLAKDLVGDHSTDDAVVGTPCYMAPEQAMGRKVTEAGDWYSVGVMLFELLTGARPFDGKPLDVLLAKQSSDAPLLAEIAPGAPEDLAALCTRLLCRNAGERPPGSEVLRVLGTGAEEPAAPNEPAAAPKEPTEDEQTFFGRARELAVLAGALRSTREGQTVTVLISGQPGIGKSALLDHFIASRCSGEIVVLRGRSYERESVPYKAVDGLIDALSRYLKRLDRAEGNALMPAEVGALTRLFPVLQRVQVVREAPVPPHTMTLDDQELRRRGFLALRSLLTRLAYRRILVLALDDLQWGDLDSAALLADLLRPPEPPPLLLLGSFRSEETERSPFLRALLAGREQLGTDVHELELGPMLEEDARSLTRSALGRDGVEQVLESIARESEGNPLFIKELVRYQQASDASLDSDLLLEQVLQRRFEQLPQETRRLLEVVAIAAGPVGETVACDAAGVGAGAGARDAVEALRAEQLIRRSVTGEDHVEAYHDRIRETVTAGLDPDAARRHHRELARALEGSGDPDLDPEVLALHFLEGGVRDRGCTYTIEAAGQAARALAFDRAAALYRTAVELGVLDGERELETREQMGQALVNAGRGGEAAEIFLQLADRLDGERAAKLRQRAAMQLLLSGRIDQGMEVVRTFLPAYAYTPRGSRRALLSLVWQRARLRLRGFGHGIRAAGAIPRQQLDQLEVLYQLVQCYQIVDSVQSATLTTILIQRALDTGDPYWVAIAHGAEALLRAFEGPGSQRRADAVLARARAYAGELDLPDLDGTLAGVAGVVATMGKGRFREGLALLDRGASILGEIPGQPFKSSLSRFMALECLYYLGEMVEIGRRVREMLVDARRRGDIWLQVVTVAQLGQFHWFCEDQPEAYRALLDETMSRWAQSGFQVGHYFAETARCNLELYSGNDEQALEGLQRHWSRMYRVAQFWQEGRVECWWWLGRARLAVACRPGGKDSGSLLKKARYCARKVGRERVNYAQVNALLLRAGIAATSGDREAAAGLLEEAEQAARSHDMALYAACARRRRGQLIGGDGGRELLQSAEAFMAEQQIRRPDRITAVLVPGFVD